MKIAVLSNINVNGIIRILKKSIDVYELEGYGNEIGTLLNQNSGLYKYKPDQIYIIEDVQELIEHTTDCNVAKLNIEQWFYDFEDAINPEIVYYLSDAFCFGPEFFVLVDTSIKEEIEYIWLSHLRTLVEKKQNVRIFPYRSLVEKIGAETAFSMKMWYMGKILHSSAMQQLIADTIIEKLDLENNVQKKVLLLDLDNTLWGGLAGENDTTPVILSDEHTGLAYKNLQRVIMQMQRQGVILGIVSKNNVEDANKIIDNHPHMILRDNMFAIKQISWEHKDKSIIEISKELNIGLDSMVFFDDNPAERQLIKEVIPEVIVPDFPDRPENLTTVMIQIWKQYFNRAVVTNEDLAKTNQYWTNSKREELQKHSASFEQYLMNLDIVMTRKISNNYAERITQLLNKTNQFNLTTKRHTLNEIQNLINSHEYDVFSYQVADKFGDSGIIAVVVVNETEDIPIIEEFVMSCRVMGKNIENAIIDDVEEYIYNKGYDSLRANYIKSDKNMPVCDLYEGLGYSIVEEDKLFKNYIIDLKDRPERSYQLKKLIEEK